MPSSTLTIGFVLFIGMIILNPTECQNATNVTTAGATSSTTSPTTSPTTSSTTPLPTTTTVFVPGTYVPPNQDLGTCTCDLTANACDVNCCCDTDCANLEKNTFSACIDTYHKPDDRVCLQKNLLMFTNVNNLPSYENVTVTQGYTADNLLCIERDNYQERNYYKIPEVANTAEEFLSYAASFYTAYPVNNAHIEGGPYYRSGERMFTAFPAVSSFPFGAIGVFGLPSQGPSSAFCNDNNPANYLMDETNECTRRITDVANDCLGLAALNAETYYNFKILSSPSILTQATPQNVYNWGLARNITPSLTAVCVNPNGIKSNCSFTGSLPSPSLVGGVCSNVVVGVDYTFVIGLIGGVVGITSASADFTLMTSVSQPIDLSQSFKAQFNTVGSGGVRTGTPRSGNPGYVFGKPVRAGRYDANLPSIALNTDPATWLTLQGAAPDGQCLTGAQGRQSVEFGVNMRTSCLLKVTYSNISTHCQAMQDEICSSLMYDITKDVRIATFGNSGISKVGDWLPIVNKSCPQTASSQGQNGVCQGISLGMHLRIVYANVGSLSNPQPKILGAQLEWESGSTIQYQCGGGYCRGDSSGSRPDTQAIEATSSVTFMDHSQPTERVVKVRPQFSTKLPADFFYPFYSNAGGRLELSAWFPVIVAALFVALQVR